MRPKSRLWLAVLGLLLAPHGSVATAASQTEPAQTTRTFGGHYRDLSPSQKRLAEDWFRRFRELTGQDIPSETFYDDFLRLSTRTTFEAVTHALGTSKLTDESGASLGTALDLVESLETVHGKIPGASGDEQFRIYVVLRPDAVATLEKSKEFRRGADNTVYHKGYPNNYRQQGGVPSIQVSIAQDERHADVDVDYRSSSFPAALLNGHLSSANSDVRAGNNYDRHNGRWTGFQNWWRGFFGLSLPSDYADTIVDQTLQFPAVPRAGKQTVEKMNYDFLHAWMVEGNVMAAMGYVSRRAYDCMAASRGIDPQDFDRGMAPFQILMGMKAVKDAIGPKESLEGVTLGIRVQRAAYRIVQQPHHAQFVLYALPDDVARGISCADPGSLHPKPPKMSEGKYGNYFASAFHIVGPEGAGETVVLLWTREEGYWKIVAYQVEPFADPAAEVAHTTATVTISRIPEDREFAERVTTFLESWLIRKNYDQAFEYLSPKCYSCYNLFKAADRPEASSEEEAGRFIRAGLERIGTAIGPRQSLSEVIASVSPTNPMVRVMEHPREETFTLVSFPNLVAQSADCTRRARGETFPEHMPEEYGQALGTLFRIQTEEGEAPVFRLLWSKENGEWRITAYDVELP